MAAEIPTAQIVGLTEFRGALRALAPQWGRELSKANRTMAKRVAQSARANAPLVGRQQAAAAGAIKGSGTQSSAAITVRQSARHPFANPAFWGQIKRTGWYADVWAEAHTGRAQGLAWVGSDWRVGVRGEGPYVINDTIATQLPKIIGDYRHALDALFHRAFPD